MRIAFFADSYKPYLSGVTNHIDILAKELRRLGHRVYIFAPNYPRHVDTDPDIIRFPSLPTGYPKFRLAIPFIKHLPEVDMVHCHSPFQAGLLGRYVARKHGVPFVYSFHTLFTRYLHYARFVPEPLSKLGIVTYLREFCRRADTILCPSEMARRALRAWNIRQPVSVIPSGVELHLLPPDLLAARTKLRKKLHLPADAKVLLYAGRLSKEKNIPFILNAYNLILKTDPEVKLVLVGGGSLYKELQTSSLSAKGGSASGGKHQNVIIAGEVPYPEILSYYTVGDIFVFSSLTETQGMVLAEAKAAGLPIVALFAGGLAGTVRSGIDGYLVPRNLEHFVGHVKRLLNDPPLLAKMSQAAREDALERFSSAAVAKQVENVYNACIEKRGGAL